MNKLPTEQVSLHYKMYKKGRFWVFAGMTMFGASLGLSLLPNQTVSAATAATDSTVVAKQATTDSSQPAADKQAGNDKDQNATTDQTTTTSDAVQTPAATTPAKTDGTTDATDQSTNQDKQQSAIKPASADINDDDADSTDDSGTTDTNDDSTTTNDDNSDDTTNTNDESTGKTNTNTDTKANQDTTTGTGVGDYDNAKPITDNPKAVVPKTDDKLSGKYAFIPKFNGSGTTTASVIGTEMSTDKPNTIATDLVTATKGQVGFKYTNVGYDADGNGMDMNILFTDWGRLSDISDAYVETYTNMIYTNFPGAGWVDVKYQFVRSDTGKEEAMSGIMTLTDIDGAQTVAISGDQWNKLDTAYVPTSEDPTTGQVDNWLRYSNENDYTIISSPKVNSDASDEYAMLTFTYSNQGSLTFRYSNGKDTPTKMTVWGVNYVPQKPLATAVIAPTATTTDSDQTNVKQNSLKDGETTYQYNFKQTIPDEWEQFYYKNVTFTGNLPTNVTLKNIKVTNETGQDVTQYFTNQSSGSNLKLTVNADYLGNADFYGHYYTITAQVNADQTDSVQTFKMSILTTIDGDSQASNTVTTTADQKHYVTTHYYIQGTTTKLAADTKIRVIAGSKYQTKAQQVTGYTLAKQTNTNGTMSTNNIQAVYEYAPITIKIPVSYVDQNGNKIFEDSNLEGKYASSIDSSKNKKDILGYTLVSSENDKGTYGLKNSPIIFHYQALTMTVPVEYVDQNGKRIAADTSIQGLYNEVYDQSSLRKNISRYNYQKTENPTGVYTLNNNPIIIHYMAESVSMTVRILVDGYLYDSYQIKGLYNDAYKIVPKDYRNDSQLLVLDVKKSSLTGTYLPNKNIDLIYALPKQHDISFSDQTFGTITTTNNGELGFIDLEYPDYSGIVLKKVDFSSQKYVITAVSSDGVYKQKQFIGKNGIKLTNSDGSVKVKVMNDGSVVITNSSKALNSKTRLVINSDGKVSSFEDAVQKKNGTILLQEQYSGGEKQVESIALSVNGKKVLLKLDSNTGKLTMKGQYLDSYLTSLKHQNLSSLENVFFHYLYAESGNNIKNTRLNSSNKNIQKVSLLNNESEYSLKEKSVNNDNFKKLSDTKLPQTSEASNGVSLLGMLMLLLDTILVGMKLKGKKGKI